MTGLSEILRDLRTEHWRIGIQLPHLPHVPPKMEKAKADVFLLLGKPSDDTQLSKNESEYWKKEARRRFKEDDWSSVNAGELKKVARCLWDGDDKLGESESFMRVFLTACAVKVRRSLGLLLISLYLRYYSQDSAGIKILGKWLKGRITNWEWGQVWCERQDTFAIFSPGAPDAIAKAVLTSKQSPSDCLNRMGISGNLLSTGLSLAAFNAGCSRIHASVSSDASTLVERLLNWATVGDGKFAFQKSKVLFIESLLGPWTEQSPTENVKNRIQGFLLDQFGDPRLPQNSHNWIVREDAKRVILRWLVKRSLDQFLDVVDIIAPNGQWKYRRAFWTAYYKKDVISDAWVAFSADGAAEVRKIARQTGDNSWLSMGKLTGSGDAKHAVFILRIGDLMIADFSHNGKCRVWKARNKYAPQPYKTEYNRHDLADYPTDMSQVHWPCEGYNSWQNKVSSWIEKQTGIRL